MRRLGGLADTGAMPASPPCEYVDVALHFQQMIRDRHPSSGDASATVAIGEPCGEPSIGAMRVEDGTVGHFCDLHLRQPKLVRG
jgi:hypothetical protein